MDTKLLPRTGAAQNPAKFEIIQHTRTTYGGGTQDGFVIMKDGTLLKSPRFKDIRFFKSRGAARKAITREKTGNMHR